MVALGIRLIRLSAQFAVLDYGVHRDFFLGAMPQAILMSPHWGFSISPNGACYLKPGAMPPMPLS